VPRKQKKKGSFRGFPTRKGGKGEQSKDLNRLRRETKKNKLWEILKGGGNFLRLQEGKRDSISKSKKKRNRGKACERH